MAKFMIVLFLSLTTGFVSYLTYTGTGQERIETLEKEESVRSNSHHSSHSSGSWSSGSSSYNSSSYGYGK